jgi:hypothetical protein
MEGYVPVATFSNEVDAQLAQATLAAAEIESFVKYEDIGHMLPVIQHIQGVKLLVDPADLEEARVLLTSSAVDPADETPQA